MLETLRKHHYILMLFIAILVCVAFVFFGDSSMGPGAPDSKPIATMNGKDYYRNDLVQIDSQRGVVGRLLDPTNQFAQYTDPLAFYANTMSRIARRYGSTGREDLDLDFCMNVATLRSEAERLGVEVDREDLEKFVQTVGGFQTNGQFDPAKYEAFLTSGAFGDKANTERRLFTTLRDVMLFQRVSKLVGGTFAPSTAEIDARYASNKQQTTAAYAVVEKAKQTPAAPTDEAIQKFYDEAKAKFEAHAADSLKPAADPVILSEEKRAIRYVLINLPKPPTPAPAPQPEDTSKLPEDQKKVKEEEFKKKQEEHTAAMTAHAEAMKAYETGRKALLEKAANLSSDLTAEERGTKTFEELAKVYDLEAKLSEPFTSTTAPEDLKAESKLVAEVFQSLNDPTIPHTLQTSNGYALFEIAKVEAPAVLPLDQVKAKVTEKLAAEALSAALKTAAETARTAILESLKAGKTFAEAATAAGLTATEIPAYTQAKPPTAVPNQAVITAAANDLNPGEVSAPLEVPEGLVLVATVKRELPRDPKMDEDKKSMTKEQTEGADGGFLPSYSPLFEAWFNARRNDTSIIKPEA
jgi:peptidyl-prolyl cis-trans isomerase D